MPTTISEEVKAFFVADTTGLVNGVDRAKKAVGELKRAYSEKVGNVKDTILNPSSLVGKGVDTLVKSMKLSAVTAGVVGAGFELASNALASWKENAAAAKQETDALSESIRRLSNANTFTTAAEGSSGLLGRLPALREQVYALREQQGKLNPHTLMDRAKLRTQYYFNYGVGGDGEDYAGEHKELDRQQNGLEQSRVGQQQAKITAQISEALSDQVKLTHERLTGDQQAVAVMELELSRQREINELRAGGVANNLAANGKTNEQLVNERINEQIYAEAQLQAAMEDRHGLALDIIGAENNGLNAQERAVSAARMQNRELENELAIRQGINTEETRGMELEQARNQETIRGAQFAELSKSPRKQANHLFEMQRRQVRAGLLQDRLNRTDGLTSIERDTSGRITGGIDIVTGEKRGVSSSFIQRDALTNDSFVERRFHPERFPKAGGSAMAALRTAGINDQSPGRTAADAARANVAAVNISNAYLKQISADISNLPNTLAFQ